MSQTGRFAHRTRVHRYVFRYLVVVAALVFSATLLTSVRVAANDGDFVPTFDNEGFVTTDFSEFDQINDIAIQPDGKIVAVGRTFDGRFQSRSRMMVTRYNADGSLDTTFGSDGIVTAGEVGTNAKANCVALQADGKIIVGGKGDFIFGPGFALLRYNIDGSLDETFGVGGIGTGGDGSPSSEIVDVAIQSDGKIVVTGGHTDLVFRFLLGATVVRYTTDGWPDETFDGRKINDLRGRPQFASEGIAIQADQKIVIAGACVVNSFNQTCLARYNSDGSLDNTFGHDGVVATSFSTALGEGDEGARDVAIQPDGKIVIAGVSFDPLGPFPLLARYNTNGSLDPHFFIGRMSFAFPQFSANAVALAPDGKIVIAGEASNPFISPFIGIARYHSDGFIDDTFENGGTAAIHVGTQSAATTVAVQADGRILAGGYGNFRVEGDITFSDFALARWGFPINHPPVVTISGPESGSIFPVNAPVYFTGTFTDDPGDTHVVEWRFDSLSQPGGFSVPVFSTSGSADTNVSFTVPGVYKVSLLVTDNRSASTVATTVNDLQALIVIYDPDGGWVAGGGWIQSPAGAYAQMPDATGKASFGFVSQYQNGASIPAGATTFHFNAGDLNFQSTSYEWLVISGRKAQYKGAGTINGSGSYRFMLTCIDGDRPGGDGLDKIRVRIWSDTNGLVYDNQLHFHEDADPSTVLGGGSIVIHP